MSQDNDVFIPLFTIIDGPSWERLCEDLKGLDYSFEQPILFKVKGIPSGVYFGTDTLSKPNFDGMCTITGVWLNGSDSEEPMKATLEYSPLTRKGRVMSITR